MIGLGTIINVALIIVGGLLGLLFGSKVNKRLQQSLSIANAVCVMLIGASGVLTKMLVVSEDGGTYSLSTTGTLMMIVSMVLGTTIGEIIGIDKGVEKFGEWLKKKTHNDNDTGFLNGFLTASFTVCIGAMAIVGSIEDALHHDYTILITKGILDCVFIMILTTSMGKGCIFSALSVAIVQGLVTVLAALLGSFLSDVAISNISYVGSILILCIGINMCFDKDIRVANMLPALIIAGLWALIPISI